ncbi:hypothetical protein GCM10010349_79500 [Streptomyces flavofungini]|nr:hypothetical protein GCM10010349_79500 [Streptomyces flavofungini]
MRILRHRTDLKTGKVTRQTVHAITDMPAHEASPRLIGRIARSQWDIEVVHHIRHTTFAEGASRIRTGHGPENIAILRILAINTLRTLMRIRDFGSGRHLVTVTIDIG